MRSSLDGEQWASFRHWLGHGAGRWILQAVLWIGVTLCAIAVVAAASSPSLDLGVSLSPASWVLLLTVPLGGWFCAVAAWRCMVSSAAGPAQSWQQSLRQSGLILMGKYLPGGVFGFLARLYDAEKSVRARHLVAGIGEQIIGLASALFVGAICYASASLGQPRILFLIMLAPFLCSAVALVCLRVLSRIFSTCPRRRGREYAPALAAASLLAIQQVGWAALAGLVAADIGGLSPIEAVGVGGSFCLAVAAGLLVFIIPGGIGIREGGIIFLAATWLGPAEAIVVASLLRLATTALDLLAGAVAVATSRVLECR